MDNLVQELKCPVGAKIFDLACGKGRHSVYLNNKGFDVTGVDLSKESILYANQFTSETLRFAVHDLREPYTAAKFDYIFNLFTSFGYFQDENDNYRACEAMSQALNPNGTLVIDFMNTFKSAANLRAKELKVVDGIEFRMKRYLENKFFVKEINFEHEKQHYQFEERVQGLTQKDFEKYFKETDLEIKEVFGSYELDYFSKNTSDRLILIVGKK